MFNNNACRIQTRNVNRLVSRGMTREEYKKLNGQWRSAMNIMNYSLTAGKSYNEQDLTCQNIYTCVSSSVPTYILSAIVGGLDVKLKRKPTLWGTVCHYTKDRKESIKARANIREFLGEHV